MQRPSTAQEIQLLIKKEIGAWKMDSETKFENLTSYIHSQMDILSGHQTLFLNQIFAEFKSIDSNSKSSIKNLIDDFAEFKVEIKDSLLLATTNTTPKLFGGVVPQQENAGNIQ
jgi:hypothetical protein